MFNELIMPPPDKILSLMPIFRQDQRAGKIDLGVGVYRDSAGVTPIPRSVKEAEKRILARQDTKAYVGPAGDPVYYDLMTRVVFSDDVPLDRIRAIQTPGGAGALAVLIGLIARHSPEATVLVPNPTWVNHVGIIEDHGLAIRTWPYLDLATGGVSFDAMKRAVAELKAGDVMLLHGCCHNPTGADLSQEEWRELAALLLKKNILSLVDIAYQGFGDGLEEDAFGVRYLASVMPEMLVASSCSKNFGTYRDRIGTAFVLAETPERAAVVQAHLAVGARLGYSMPPDHGAAIVRTILEDAALTADWRAELDGMRANIVSLRKALSESFRRYTNSSRYDFLERNKGMFSLIGITPEQATRLREEFAIYVVEDGRINVAGLRPDQVDTFAKAVIAVTS